MRWHRIQWRHRPERGGGGRGERVFYKWGNRSENRATCLCKERGNSVCTVEASSLLLLLRKPISKRGTQNLPTLLFLSCTWSSKATVSVRSPTSSLSPKPLRLLLFPRHWDSSATARGCVSGGRGCIWPVLWRRFPPPQDRSTTSACCCYCCCCCRKRVEEGMKLWKGLEHHPCYDDDYDDDRVFGEKEKEKEKEKERERTSWRILFCRQLINWLTVLPYLLPNRLLI